MTAAQRGDMVEALLPTVAALVEDVHEHGADEVQNRLAGLSRHELEVVAVIAAALVDPDRSLREALGWVDFDEQGEKVTPRLKAGQGRTIRDAAAPQVAGRIRVRTVDSVAAHRVVSGQGAGVSLSDAERRLAVVEGMRRGLPVEVIAERVGIDARSVKQSWMRSCQQARQDGLPVPEVGSMRLRAVA